MTTPLLRVQDLEVRFTTEAQTHCAVNAVSFELHRGERFALVGESGSGKTVSALSILRLLPDAQTSGQILWANGESPRDLLTLPERELRGIRGREIAMVFQEPMSALNPLFTVGQQIAEVLELHEGLSRAKAFARAVELLDRTGVDEPQRRAQSYPHQLSGGQRQRVVIAMALACKPALLIADEPTTALDVTIREQVLELLLDIQREDGMAIMLITHDLPLVERFAQRVGVMQLGRLIEHNTTRELFAAPHEDYTHRLLSSRPQRMVAGTPEGPSLVDAQQLRCEFAIPNGWWKKREFVAVDNASFSIRKGETLGVVGESGSGKTTLALAMLRLSSARVSGTLGFESFDLNQINPFDLRMLRKRMQIVFQDPFSALSPRMTVGQILEEGLKLHFAHLTRIERDTRVAEMLEEVGLPADSVGRYPHEFSGGQRQRIAIARAAILKPDLLVLDEPTSALDVSIQQQVLELLVRLQRHHGMAYLLITHDLAVIRAMAHRVMVMQHGQVVESGTTVELLEHPKMAYTQQLIHAAFATETL
jgi:microcin C transport system ATP-binding protein